jgi:hypothetical protein
MTDQPTHLIMVVNRETFELKLVSAHGEAEAHAAFENLSSLFAATPNDVHKVPIPTAIGFCASQIETSKGAVAKPAPKRAQPAPTIAAPNGASDEDDDPGLAYGRWV